jgi:hypothetical protein
MRAPHTARVKALAVVAFAMAALIAFPGSAFATRTLGLSAGTFKFDVAAGDQVSGQVIVMNDGTEPLKVMVYASDQSVDAKGGVTYVAPTRADLASLNQPSAWTTIKMPANSKSLGNIPYMELAPGKRIPVRFSFLVPPNVPPGDHNVLIFFESFEPPKTGQNSQSVISGRLGARVTLRVKGTLLNKIEVRPFVVPAWVIGDTIPYDFTVRNVGNTDQRVGARVLLLDRVDNEATRQTAIDGLVVFAGTNLESTGTVSAGNKNAVGPYKLRLDVSPVDDAGKATNAGGDTITEEHTVWLIPIWLIVAVIVVVVLLIALIIWAVVRSSGRRKRRMSDDAYQRGLSDATKSPEAQEAPEE